LAEGQRHAGPDRGWNDGGGSGPGWSWQWDSALEGDHHAQPQPQQGQASHHSAQSACGRAQARKGQWWGGDKRRYRPGKAARLRQNAKNQARRGAGEDKGGNQREKPREEEDDRRRRHKSEGSTDN